MICVVLYEPEIPQNTGNIMRTCVDFGMNLYLIEPLGFKLDDQHLKRAHMDYIEKLNYKVYKNFDAFISEHNNGQFAYFSRYGMKSFGDCVFDKTKDIYLVFGKESTGIPRELLKDRLDDVYRIPMKPDCRTLNLSNCVAIGAYECVRQTGFEGLSDKEVIKGADWILKV